MDQAAARRTKNDSRGVPAVWLSESGTIAIAGAPGYTSGASSGMSSPDAVPGPGTRTGAPRSSASAARTRATVHGARLDAPAGGAPTTSATMPFTVEFQLVGTG